MFILLYLFYCFAVITVFQAFFVSKLVQPGQPKQIKTFDVLLRPELFYGMNSAVELAVDTIGYEEHHRFPA
jgi:hypothetical protein